MEKKAIQGKHSGSILDDKEFDAIKADLKKFEERREQAIAGSREIITMSKQIIYSIHRGDVEKAESLMPQIKKMLQSLPKEFVETDMPHVAMQEYVEAATYLAFVKTGKIPTRKELGVDTNCYLSGLCDLTGEVMRKAIKDVIEHKYDSAKSIYHLVEELYDAFLQFDLRGGELRKKSDQIKWNLKKLEDVMYDLELKGRMTDKDSEPQDA